MAIFTDLRHAVRLLGRSPVFTLTSVASLAIGIGAAATIFSLTDALLSEPTAGVPNEGGGRFRRRPDEPGRQRQQRTHCRDARVGQFF